ncbi:MAG: ATP-binding protein [Thermoplasmata archaeon]|nr:ATP-binding protein [Thermoplasmata archaeon]
MSERTPTKERPATTEPTDPTTETSLGTAEVPGYGPTAPESPEGRFRRPFSGPTPSGTGHLAYQRLHANLTALKLSTVEGIVDGYLESTVAEGRSVVEAMDYLFDQEVKVRNSAALETRLKLAGFPVRKTFEAFDLSAQPSIDPKVIQELRTLRFIHNAESVVFLGPPGVGKSHLALALGHEAIKAGFLVYYIGATQLISELKKANETDRLAMKLKTLGRYPLLIIDEIGYLPMEREGAHLFFQLVSRRYERGATIYTSNKPYSDWGEVLGDPVIAAATLDRILHHSTTVNIKGESYRLMSRRKAGVPPTPPVPVEA